MLLVVEDFLGQDNNWQVMTAEMLAARVDDTFAQFIELVVGHLQQAPHLVSVIASTPLILGRFPPDVSVSTATSSITMFWPRDRQPNTPDFAQRRTPTSS